MTEKSDYLYRILKFHHAVQLFEKGELYFSHPSGWEDPYEVRVKHKWDHKLYAQCWCKKSMSDAMWRIYSPDRMSVRIKTTREKLCGTMADFTRKKEGYKRRLIDVDYLSTKEIEEKTNQCVKTIKLAPNDLDAITGAADILCLKRLAFDHEKEVRAILFCPSKANDTESKGIGIKIKPHEFIQSILIDPRAPKELFQAFKHYFENVLEFKGPVAQSSLYEAPQVLVVERDDEL